MWIDQHQNPVSLQVKDNIVLSSDLNTKESVIYANTAEGSGSYMALHPSGRSWEVSREKVHVIKIIGKGAFSQVAQATVKNEREHHEETTVAVKMLKGWFSLIFVIRFYSFADTAFKSRQWKR